MNERTDPSGVGSEGGVPEDAGLSVDEKFAKLAAEIDGTRVQGPGAKEEAARTRELRAKWSKNPPEPMPWRADGPKPSEPGPAPTDWGPWQSKGEVKRERARKSAKVVLGLALVGLITYGFWPRHHTPAPLNANPAGTAAPWTASPAPDASASPSPTFTNPDDQYFADSPALTWADNEAGFAVPKAAALNGVSRSDIVDGYQQLEKLMEAGNLDATILDGGSIRDFTNLLDPSTGMAKDLNSYIAHPSYNADPTGLVSRFNPATTRLLGHTVKVSGSMSAKPGPHHYTVLLTADYIFVYAVTPSSGTGGETSRVEVHRSLQVEVVNPAYYESVAGKAWIYTYAASTGNIECYRYDGYIEPGFDDGGADPNETGVADPYATGNLLTASAQPSATSTLGVCQEADRD